MCIIKHSLVCEVTPVATSALFALTKKTFLTWCGEFVSWSRCLPPAPAFFFVWQRRCHGPGVLITVLSLIKNRVLSQLGCPQVGN